MVPFVDGVLQRKGGAFQSSNVITHVHQQSGVGREFLNPSGNFHLQLIARTHVYLGFFEADGSGLPNTSVADGDHSENEKDSGESHAVVGSTRTQRDIDQYCRGSSKCWKQLQSVTNVIVGKRPPVRDEDGDATISHGERVERNGGRKKGQRDSGWAEWARHSPPDSKREHD